MTSLAMWVLYDHPSDFPTLFVARRVEITEDGVQRAANDVLASDSLDGIRAAMVSRGLRCLTRSPHDDPVIIETWL